MYDSIETQIQATAFEAAMKYPDYKILFVGHSMGAALAQLAALHFYDVHGMDSRISVFSYASPRIGNADFARNMNNLPYSSRLYRVNVRGDPIPHLPLLPMGFEHPVQQYNVLKNGEIIKCKNDGATGESSECLRDYWDLDFEKHTGYFGYYSGC